MNKKILSLTLATSLIFSSMALTVNAAIIKEEGVKVPAVNGVDFTPQNDGFNPYKEATNSFDDGDVKYYLVTQDPNKANETSVTYQGKTYELASVKVVQPSEKWENLVFDNAGSGNAAKLLSSKSEATNYTIFFDDGTYFDEGGNNYAVLHKVNASFVGLSDVDVSKGEEPKVIFRRAISTADRSKNRMERYVIGKPNLYVENIAFDGQGIDMAAGSYGQALLKVGNGVESVDGLVLRDVVIYNVGGSTGTYNARNRALELYNAVG